MVRSFFTFLNGFLFVLVAVPAICLLSFVGTFFGRHLYEGEFVDDVYEVGVSVVVDEVMDSDVHFSKVLSSSDVAEVVRDSFDLETVRGVFLDGVDRLNSRGDSLTVSLMGIHDEVSGFIDNLTDKYISNLSDCDEVSDFGTNLPSCVDGSVDRDDVLKKISSRVEKRVFRSFPLSYDLRSDSFFLSKLISLGARQLIVAVLVSICLLFLFLMAFTRYPYLKQMLWALAGVIGVVAVIVYLLALFSAGALFSGFVSIVNGSGDLLLKMFEIVVRYWFASMKFSSLILIGISVVFGLGAILVRKKRLKLGRK